MRCIKGKIREYTALFAVWHLGPEPKGLPRVNLTVGPLEEPQDCIKIKGGVGASLHGPCDQGEAASSLCY